MKEVHEKILLKREPYIRKAFVLGDWFIKAYEPISDFRGKIVGMLYVGMMEAKYREMK